VLKVPLGDVVDCDAALVDTTSKSYAVLAASPVRVTECAVTRVVSCGDEEP